MVAFPIDLEGDNLGKRHEFLNGLVDQAFENNLRLEAFENAKEHSPIDRIFKIDLAAKYRNVDYLLRTLKDADMLYVSRAMKCSWFVEEEQYSYIMNPVYLEEHIYPNMLTTAASKMKKWILKHLKDSSRCQQFYEFYKTYDIDYAGKFLANCPVSYFLGEMINIKSRITPHLLKLLCEKSTKAAEVYFKVILADEDNIPDTWFNNENKIISNMVILLKNDPELYFYIIETFYRSSFNKCSKETTSYIMKYHRNKFDAKPELYATWILDLGTLAKYLKSEEIKSLIVSLVRSEYLGQEDIEFRDIEILFKYIDFKERTDLKKKVFVDKSFGDKILKPPYKLPSPPEKKEMPRRSWDEENYDSLLESPKMMECCCRDTGGLRIPGMSWELQILFNKYRNFGFDKTLQEISKNIKTENSLVNRQNLLLVLVSKTGGEQKHLERLIDFIYSKHSNEPPTLRATVVRSLVKRARIWRLPEFLWCKVLEFAKDLGLDGSCPEAQCIEGIHAVILRHILQNREVNPALLLAFLNDFSTFKAYNLRGDERRCIFEHIPQILLNVENDSETLVKRIEHLLDFLAEYKLPAASYNEAVAAVHCIASQDIASAAPLFHRLYKAKVGRKELFLQNFNLIQSDESYLNVLRHDCSMLLTASDMMKNIIKDNKLKHDRFFRKISIYFTESNGLCEFYASVLEQCFAEKKHPSICRVMGLLTVFRIQPKPNSLNAEFSKANDRQSKQIQYAYMSNMHFKRPVIELHGANPKDLGLVTMARIIQICSVNTLRDNLPKLKGNPRLSRIVLALRSSRLPGIMAETIPHAASKRAMIVLKIALRIICKNKKVIDKIDWEAVKCLIENTNLKNKHFNVYKSLAKLNKIHSEIRVDYAVTVFKALAKAGFGHECGPPFVIETPLLACVFRQCSEVDTTTLHDIVLQVLSHFDALSKTTHIYFLRRIMESYLGIVVHYLLKSKSDKDLDAKFDEICCPLLDKLKSHDRMLKLFYEKLKCTEHFIQPSDVYILLLEKIQNYNNINYPIEEYFVMNYVNRFTILYLNVVRTAIAEQPELFVDTNNREGKELLAFNFGKIIACDIEDLVKRYFVSIRSMYMVAIRDYIKGDIFTNFSRQNSFSTSRFLEGLTDDLNATSACLVAKHISRNHDVENDINFLKATLNNSNVKNVELDFFLNAGVHLC